MDPLKKVIIEQNLELPHKITETQMRSRNEVRKLKRDQSKQDAERLKQSLSTSLQRSMDLTQEKGASTWLTTLPIREFGFNLHKGAFLDALALRYNWQPSRTPTTCACGRNFSVDHALSCPKGGFPSIRHNEIRDIVANLLSEVCNDACIESDLQPINGEQHTGYVEDGARLDIAANGFWGRRFEHTYIDVRVFNPHAPSNRHSNCYRKHELEKTEQHVREVEHASFTPLLMSATGGMANHATIFYKRLASSLALKWDQPYSSTIKVIVPYILPLFGG